MSWDWFLLNAKEIMQTFVLILGYAFVLWIVIGSRIRGSIWYDGEIRPDWEKEDAKKAREEEQRRKNKQWWEA